MNWAILIESRYTASAYNALAKPFVVIVAWKENKTSGCIVHYPKTADIFFLAENIITIISIYQRRQHRTTENLLQFHNVTIQTSHSIVLFVLIQASVCIVGANQITLYSSRQKNKQTSLIHLHPSLILHVRQELGNLLFCPNFPTNQATSLLECFWRLIKEKSFGEFVKEVWHCL